MNTIPSLSQASNVCRHLVLKAWTRVWPGVSADLATLEDSRGLATVTSRAVSRPPDQCGMRTSAGRSLLPGRRACSSFLGGQVGTGRGLE